MKPIRRHSTQLLGTKPKSGITTGGSPISKPSCRTLSQGRTPASGAPAIFDPGATPAFAEQPVRGPPVERPSPEEDPLRRRWSCCGISWRSVGILLRLTFGCGFPSKDAAERLLGVPVLVLLPKYEPSLLRIAGPAEAKPAKDTAADK